MRERKSLEPDASGSAPARGAIRFARRAERTRGELKARAAPERQNATRGGCPCGSKYPGGNVNEGVCVDDICYGKNPIKEGTQMGRSTAIEDEVRVPATLPAGEYVVGFRWDCETSSQVWTSCAVRAYQINRALVDLGTAV